MVTEDPDGLQLFDPHSATTILSIIDVGHSGFQVRTFHYSSLGLLKDATNPESGTVSHIYTLRR